MNWHDMSELERLAEIKKFHAQGLSRKEVAAIFAVNPSTITNVSIYYGIEWPKGARKGNKNAEIHGEGHNTIKRLTKQILLTEGRDITTCERCNWTHPLGESLARHHKDRNRNNNHPNNLEVLCQSCHSKEHLNDRSRNEAGQFQTDDSGGGLG